jgi:hypothetical protein
MEDLHEIAMEVLHLVLAIEEPEMLLRRVSGAHTNRSSAS